MSEDYSTIAEGIQSHPYFGPLQTILDCPEKTVRGDTVKDKILFREDPFRTHSTRISTARAQRQNKKSQSQHLVTNVRDKLNLRVY